MASLLYHWNFTGDNNLTISNDESRNLDSESNLVASKKEEL